MGLSNISGEAKKAAYLLLSGVDRQSEEVATYRELYGMFLKERAAPQSKQAENE
jgi:hypothetical protein